jgi:hypothetical protein
MARLAAAVTAVLAVLSSSACMYVALHTLALTLPSLFGGLFLYFVVGAAFRYVRMNCSWALMSEPHAEKPLGLRN